MGGKQLTLIGLFGALGFVQLLSPSSVGALGYDRCKDANNIDIVYVRGSGEMYKGSFYKALYPSLSKNLNDTKFNLSELHPDLVKDSVAEYMAVGVAGNFDARYTGASAVISGGSFGKYKLSVRTGVNLLSKYLKDLSRVPNECVVLLGYSQGAHVIGDTLTELAIEYPGILDRIIYVGLFGDPKLDLRGEGFSLGKNIPWYRGDAFPVINGGSLGSRVPYVPKFNEEYMKPVGSWCYEDDFICTENYMTAPTISAHGKYPERSFSQMSLEVADAINDSLGHANDSQSLGVSCGAAKQDIVVLLDTSPLMRRDAKLFSDTPMYDPFHATPQGAKLPARTAGQMLTSVGCGDTRLAVMGYGQAGEGPPRLLLNFTSNAAAYDALMKSLYQPSATGVYDRTQFREGALEALSVEWRDDANRTIYALTDIAGSGPEWGGGTSGYTDSLKQDVYKKDALTQQVIMEARNKNTVILGLPIKHSYSGYAQNVTGSNGDVRSYLNMFTDHTGGYNWNKEWINYGEYNFKFSRLHDSLNEALQRQDKLIAVAAPVKGKVGERLSIKLVDTLSLIAAAKLRHDSINYRWYIDCSNKTVAVSTSSDELTFVPTAPQNCTGNVIVTVKNMTGNGCYSGCPETFPPYMQRSFPFEIDILPRDYVPKIPAQITHIQKTIFDDKVEYAWEAPAYNGNETLVYVVRDEDGSVLAATTTRSLTITDTQKTDPPVYIEAAGLDGRSVATPSDSASVVLDMRINDVVQTIDLPIIAPGEDIDSSSSESTEHEISEEVSSHVQDASYDNETKNNAISPFITSVTSSLGLRPQFALETSESDGSIYRTSAPENNATVLGESTSRLNRDSIDSLLQPTKTYGAVIEEEGGLTFRALAGLLTILAVIFLVAIRFQKTR